MLTNKTKPTTDVTILDAKTFQISRFFFIVLEQKSSVEFVYRRDSCDVGETRCVCHTKFVLKFIKGTHCHPEIFMHFN